MAGEVGKSAFQCRDVFLPQRVARDAAMHFQRPYGCHYDRGVRLQSRLTAFYIEEFLGSEISAEPRLGHNVIGQLERRGRGDDGVAAMRDVAERAAMDEGRIALERLHEVWRDRVLEQYRHCARRLEVGCT